MKIEPVHYLQPPMEKLGKTAASEMPLVAAFQLRLSLFFARPVSLPGSGKAEKSEIHSPPRSADGGYFLTRTSLDRAGD